MKTKPNDLTEDEAVALYDSGFWKQMSHEEIAKFQLIEDRLCMPFEIFHEAIEKALGRPVWTHEFGLNREGLIKELFHGAPAPSLEEIINLIPEEKRIVRGSMKKGSEKRRCRICGCTDDDCRQCIEKTGEPCYWVEDDLCSACIDEAYKKEGKRTPQTCKYCAHRTDREKCPHFKKKDGNLPDNGTCKKFKKGKPNGGNGKKI